MTTTRMTRKLKTPLRSNSDPMPPQVTDIDVQVLRMIDSRLTYEEMAIEMGLSAKSGVFRRVQKLITMQLVEKDPLKSRSRRLTEHGRRILSGEPVIVGSPASK